MLAVDELDGFEQSTVVDMGAGNGILGIGALLLGASKVIFVETDPAALDTIETNIDALEKDLRGRANYGRPPLDWMNSRWKALTSSS